MLGKLKILVIAFALLCPRLSFAEGDTTATEPAQEQEDAELTSVYNNLTTLDWGNSEDPDRKALYDKLDSLMKDLDQNMDDLKKNYEDLKANEQSLANRTLTAVTTAATGIGGMELATGLSEQKADKEADQAMDALIATMRCTYGDDKQVKAGTTEIELPGGNNQQLMNYRAEYFALAADLKERKDALGMKAGIESEEILDKAQMGLYDDESTGITSGAYASRYRATMLGSETDQSKLTEEQKASKNRVIAGAVVGGVGVVGGIAGNAIINKDSPKNKAEEITQRRTKIKQEIDDLLNSEIERCNNLITKNQQYASTLKSDADAMQDERIQQYVAAVEKLQKLTTIDDIVVIKEHPLCK